MNDPYSAPGADILKNKLGITDAQELQQAERRLTALRIIELRQKPIQGKLDLDHLKKIHKHIFQDLYKWAGQERTVGISKGDVFCLPEHIGSAGKEIFDKLAKADHFKGLSADQFAEKAGALLSDINHLHPFREGNGRTQREFLLQVARNAGHNLEWGKISDERIIEASKDAMRGRDEKLIGIVKDIISTPAIRQDRLNEIMKPPANSLRNGAEREYRTLAKKIVEKEKHWPGEPADRAIIKKMLGKGFMKENISKAVDAVSPTIGIHGKALVNQVAQEPEVKKTLGRHR